MVYFGKKHSVYWNIKHSCPISFDPYLTGSFSMLPITPQMDIPDDSDPLNTDNLL